MGSCGRVVFGASFCWWLKSLEQMSWSGLLAEVWVQILIEATYVNPVSWSYLLWMMHFWPTLIYSFLWANNSLPFSIFSKNFDHFFKNLIDLYANTLIKIYSNLKSTVFCLIYFFIWFRSLNIFLFWIGKHSGL